MDLSTVVSKILFTLLFFLNIISKFYFFTNQANKVMVGLPPSATPSTE
jgi:hypothetical protein